MAKTDDYLFTLDVGLRNLPADAHPAHAQRLRELKERVQSAGPPVKPKLLCNSVIKASQELDKAIVQYMKVPNDESLQKLMEKRFRLYRLTGGSQVNGQVCEGG
jgi:hypothetical protein